MGDLATNNLTMESTTDATTDINGEITLELIRTPVTSDGIIPFCGTAGYIAILKSLSTKTVTVVIKRLKYERAVDTLTGPLSNLPSGVTEVATSTIITSTGPNKDSGFNSSDPVTPPSHNHSINKLFRHDHTITHTETDMPIAKLQEGISVTFTYAYS